MAYTTPTSFIAKHGLEEVAQLLADEQALLTSQLLLDAISVAANGFWTGEPSEAEMAAAQAALARLERQIATTSNYMDSYLRSAVALPLAPLDANAGTLEDCCIALVRCGLADDSDNATERSDKQAEQWRAWLKDVAKGLVQLVGPGGQPVPVNAKAGARSGQAVTGLNWAVFGGVQR